MLNLDLTMILYKIDDNYHKPDTMCSLLNIPYFKPVTNVLLDYMHLEIMRKLLNLWFHGELQYRLHRAVDDISTHLITKLKPSYLLNSQENHEDWIV